MINGSMGRTKSDLRVHSKGGRVIIVVDTADREVEIDLNPTQATVLASLLLKHTTRASQPAGAWG